MKILEKISQKVWWALIASPIGFLLLLMILYSENCPYCDQWDFVEHLEKFYNGSFQFNDLISFHSGAHLIIFPRLIMLGLAWISRWNIYYEIAINFLLAVVSFLFLVSIAKNTFKNRTILYFSLFITSLIVFSTNQYENWIWGWQLQWFLNLLAVVIAIWAIGVWKQRHAGTRLIVAMVASVVATLSLASGSFIWISCLPLLFYHREMRKFLILWMLVGGILLGWHFLNIHASKVVSFQNPFEILKGFIFYAISPLLSFSDSLSTFRKHSHLISSLSCIYICFIVLIVFLCKKLYKHEKTFSSLLPWFCIAIYSGLTGISICLGRINLFIAFKKLLFKSNFSPASFLFNSRYITISSLILLAVMMIILKFFENHIESGILFSLQKKKENFQKKLSFWLMMILCGMTIVMFINDLRGVESFRRFHNSIVFEKNLCEEAKCSQDLEKQQLSFKICFLSAEEAWHRLKFLRSKQLCGMSDSSQKLEENSE